MSARQIARRAVAVLFVFVIASSSPARADVRLPSVIGDHMVVQRDIPVPIWGWADQGEEVAVTLGETTASARPGADGRWMVKLPAIPAGGPLTLIVKGKNTIKVTDILVGEVWVCSGQSNMEMGINSIQNAEKEVATAQYPNIRLYHLCPYKTATEPQDDFKAEWHPCSPDTIKKTGAFWTSGFPATAYFFGRQLHEELDVPVGLIATAWGGTRIEPWTPRVGFELVPSLKDILKIVDEATPKFNAAVRKAVEDTEKWLPAAKKAVEQGKRVPPPPEWPKHRLESNTEPTSIYNAMVHPLIPFGIRGAIWYQGESNHMDGMAYFDKMQALINGWRKIWGQGDFPFYYVQIAPFDALYPDDTLPRLWEAQLAALSIPNTGMVVTVDIADLKDIHPKNKQDVGKRLALWALARTYGKTGFEYSGPLYKSMAVDDGKIRIHFDHVGAGLISRDGKPLNWFEIAGEDRKFVKAEAIIDGDTVLVSSAEVPKPVAVRFGWSRKAEPNLSNKAGLPASPFRTDKW
ncbi:MAG: sialate O-acetylesterase [Phycisphaerae bacterium]